MKGFRLAGVQLVGHGKLVGFAVAMLLVVVVGVFNGSSPLLATSASTTTTTTTVPSAEPDTPPSCSVPKDLTLQLDQNNQEIVVSWNTPDNVPDGTTTYALKYNPPGDNERSASSPYTIPSATDGDLQPSTTYTVSVRLDATGCPWATESATTPPSVVIGEFDTRSRFGAGVMSSVFTVTPNTASCTAESVPDTSEATVSLTYNVGRIREVSVDIPETGSATLRVTCSADDYTTSSRTAEFTAEQLVAINGLDDTKRCGAGEMEDVFDLPGSAVGATCSAERVSGSVGAGDVSFSLADVSGTARRLVVTTTTTGTVVVRVTCSSGGGYSASESATFTAEQLVAINGLDDTKRYGAGEMEDVFDLPGSAVGATCSAERVSGSVGAGDVSFSLADVSGTARRLVVTTTTTGTVVVRVTCSSGGGYSASESATFTAEVLDQPASTGQSVSISRLSDKSTDALAGAMSVGFRVSPRGTVCSAERVSGPSASVVLPAAGSHGSYHSNYTLQVDPVGTGVVKVRVVCANPGFDTKTQIVAFTAGGVPSISRLSDKSTDALAGAMS
ncbi:MAG: fibronectin type III domain-containing protein, partial [Acidimicrobiaceae bacterium]|nr:fibronectin type III domain-containing protein [Acidimicrobiaceae bacterium]